MLEQLCELVECVSSISRKAVSCLHCIHNHRARMDGNDTTELAKMQSRYLVSLNYFTESLSAKASWQHPYNNSGPGPFKPSNSVWYYVMTSCDNGYCYRKVPMTTL